MNEDKAELTEDYLVEQPAINWLKGLGYSYIHGSELNPDNGERKSYRHVIFNQKQIMILRKIRDTLLPMLVFGRLRVEEI